MIVYFSGTGNSRFAAEFLSKQLNDELLDTGRHMKAGEKDTLHSDRPWVFVAPIYAWRMANVLADYIRSAELTGSKDAYFVLTCGGEIGNAGQYAAQLCKEIGLNYKGVLEVVMPENYIALFRAPGPEEARAIVAAAVPGLEEGAERIRRGESLPPVRRGAIDKLKSGPVNAFFYRFVIKSGPFRSTSACVGCGKCAAVCVENNIRLRDGRPVWGDRCTHCMACICGCPAGAIEYGRASRGKPRYQCPEYREE